MVKELGKNPTIQIYLKGSDLSGRQAQITIVFSLADKCLIFLRSYDIKEKHTHKIFKGLLAIKWLKQTRTTFIVRNTERKKASVPYNLLWFRNSFLFLLSCEFDTWPKICILRQEPGTSPGSLLPCPAGEKVHTSCPPHNPGGFLVQVHHHTEWLYTASRFPASPSIWTAFSGYSSPLRTRHSEKHNHAHRAQSAYPRPSAIWKQIARTIPSHLLLSKMEKMGLARLSDSLVALLSERKTEEADLSSPESHSKRILVNLYHIIKLLEKNAVCRSYSNILSHKGL